MSSAAAPFVPRLNQIALSVVDLRLTERWFREGLGFLPAGGSRLAMRTPLASRIQGLPKAASTCWWLVDRNERVPARAVPVREAAGEADARGLSSLRHRLHAHRRVGRRFRCVAAAAGGARNAPADARAGPARRATHLRTQPGRCLRRADGERPASPRSLHRRAETAARRCARSRCRYRTCSRPRASSNTASDCAKRTCPCTPPSTRRCGDSPAHARRARLSSPATCWWRRCSTSVPEASRGPRAIASRIRASSTSRSAHATSVTSPRCIAAALPPARGPIASPCTWRARASSTSTTRRAFPSSFCGPNPDSRIGCGASSPCRSPGGRRRTRRRSNSVCGSRRPSNEPGRSFRTTSAWRPGSGSIDVTITRSGTPDRNGYGAVRQMKGLPGTVQEEVLAWNPPHGYRYRVTQGSPFVCHQGEVRLQPVGSGDRAGLDDSLSTPASRHRRAAAQDSRQRAAQGAARAVEAAGRA